MENIRLAFQGIWGHKLRSFLTMLGIIIGIASIITIVSTIKGTNEQIKANLIGSGNNVVKVQLYQADYAYDMTYQGIPDGVRPIEESMRQTLEELKGVEQVSFYHCRNYSDSVYYQNTNFNGAMYGIDNAYFQVNGYRVVSGRKFLQSDYDRIRKVAIIDDKSASSLFGSADPVGQVLEIKGEPFVIVGVVEQTSSFTPTINNLNDYNLYADTSSGAVFIPDASWPVVYQFDEPQSVAVRAYSTDDMTVAGKLVADKLTETQIAASAVAQGDSGEGEMDEEAPMPAEEEPSENNGFSYRSENQLEIAEQLQNMSNASNQQLIWIASISLLVGGIGVMNIMLVSVTERTSEIGLKKALGAKKRRIRGQFLMEAAVLTCLGGILGVCAGIGMAELISRANEIPVAISVPAILIAVLFSTVIGVIFGLLPAVKAANLSPIEALRRE